MLVAGPALACSPALNAESATVLGEGCSVRHLRTPVGAEGLMPAENLWLGYVVQVHYEGDACYVRESQVVVDCADGSAFLFGPHGAMTVEEHMAAMDGTYGKMATMIRKMPWGYAEMAAWDDIGDLRLEQLGSVLEPVVLGGAGQSYDLSCACGLFNPGSVGAGK
ncbi:hypothetical protein [Antarctobacter sp.]|uniref:hypothetical protein n=1 Tax=Antarctobacter sp. TaxID=1872577 RepID=UPI002B26D20F|nr:hypothetical protein [Antarctobacter sp.]